MVLFFFDLTGKCGIYFRNRGIFQRNREMMHEQFFRFDEKRGRFFPDPIGFEGVEGVEFFADADTALIYDKFRKHWPLYGNERHSKSAEKNHDCKEGIAEDERRNGAGNR